jgi:hypothetical protein
LRAPILFVLALLAFIAANAGAVDNRETFVVLMPVTHKDAEAAAAELQQASGVRFVATDFDAPKDPGIRNLRSDPPMSKRSMGELLERLHAKSWYVFPYNLDSSSALSTPGRTTTKPRFISASVQYLLNSFAGRAEGAKFDRLVLAHANSVMKLPFTARLAAESRSEMKAGGRRHRVVVCQYELVGDTLPFVFWDGERPQLSDVEMGAIVSREPGMVDVALRWCPSTAAHTLSLAGLSPSAFEKLRSRAASSASAGGWLTDAEIESRYGDMAPWLKLARDLGKLRDSVSAQDPSFRSIDSMSDFEKQQYYRKEEQRQKAADDRQRQYDKKNCQLLSYYTGDWSGFASCR